MIIGQGPRVWTVQPESWSGRIVHLLRTGWMEKQFHYHSADSCLVYKCLGERMKGLRNNKRNDNESSMLKKMVTLFQSCIGPTTPQLQGERQGNF